ncbi:CYTH and CHAD domain-containing protein [Streptomyces sp. NBC_01808]|uniref:CYTH and CHAD domain-containing protein n=1 Tax=Streptomyces sp. NBC_01808 TaxID=2975947 RepID=UPI002DDBED2D|nr:CYTH and CHAD domain-containing protein [Streptomyces sp. NBC_01808]WSA37814.1 CYTH and CHAD domain-containing protein [Streptomyces sp. NBC_01808]
MVDTVREIERKYEATAGTRELPPLPDLTGVDGVASVIDQGTALLDAVYYDTAARRLAADGITLRRRTGGDDAGWHLKLPVAAGVRDEIRAPLGEGIPRRLAALVRSRTRDAELAPVVRIRTERDVYQLLDADGEPVAEVSVDRVTAKRPETGATAEWAEVEAELSAGGDPEVLDAVDAVLTGAGLRRSAAASKLARALAETDEKKPKSDKKSDKKSKDGKDGKGGKKKSADKKKAGKKSKGKKGDKKKAAGKKPVEPAARPAGDLVLDYVRAQITAVVALDPAVRRDQPDAVHQMRVASRRLRSTFRSYRAVLDRTVTDPVSAELRWLAGELGVDRDREVLTERIHAGLAELDRPLVLGPVRGRLRTWSAARRTGSRRRIVAVLDGRRYLALLDALDGILTDPPLRTAAGRPAEPVLREAVDRQYRRFAGSLQETFDLAPGPDRDTAIHETRKAAKRTRYAAEVARPALGREAKTVTSLMREVQQLLGDYQDGVLARSALREIAVQAQAAGEPSFTYGVLYAREEARAAELRDRLPRLSRKHL